MNDKQPKKLGLATATSLVIGNMIGAGVFMLPAALGQYGGIGLFGWLISATGAFVLSIVFSNLSKMIPGANGGPYTFTRAGLGDFAGFLVAWGYWVSIWISNASLAVAFVSYLTVFFPVLETNVWLAVLTGLSAIWFLTWINTLRINKAGFIQTLTTALKLIPLILVSIGGLFFIKLEHFESFNVSGQSNLAAIVATTTLTLFAFLGLESATIVAKHVKDSETLVKKATRWGTLITIGIYILGSASVMGIIPPEQLAESKAPFADAAAIMWGSWARYLVAFGAIVSTFGALNGWIIIQGKIPAAIAQDKLFPAVFGRENSKGSPSRGIILSSILASLIMVLNYQKGLVKAFEFMILLSTLSILVPYLFSTASYGLMLLTDRAGRSRKTLNLIAACLAFLFSMWAIIGSGAEVVYWGFILLMAGVPMYVWVKRRS